MIETKKKFDYIAYTWLNCSLLRPFNNVNPWNHSGLYCGTVIFREELDLVFAQFANPTLDRERPEFCCCFYMYIPVTCISFKRKRNFAASEWQIAGKSELGINQKKKKFTKKQHTQVFYCFGFRQKHTLNGNKTRFNHLEKLYTISIVIYSKYHHLMQLTHRHGWISMLIPETSSQSIFFFFLGICHQITVDTKRVTLRICQKKRERQQIENKTVI